MGKAEVEVISIALIITLTLTFIGLAYTWLYPWIVRKQEEIKVERLLSDFDPDNPKSLSREIEYIAKVGGEATFRVSSNGIWRLYPSEYPAPENNSIDFYVFSKAIIPKIPIGTWKNLTKDLCPAPKGRIGEIPYAVCVRADPYGDGYNITFRVMFRELEETELRGSKIALEKWTAISPVTSTSREIKIKRESIYPKLLDGKTLIITEIKISLV